MTRPRTARRPRGFTLIELMIVAAVIAILAAIAYPSYRDSIARGARAQAASQLLTAHQWMERWYTENLRYDQNRAGTAVTAASQFPASFSQSPPPGEGGARYTIAVTAQQQAYTITATRTGSMARDACGDLRIDHLGRRSTVNHDATRYPTAEAAVAACWRT